jgi:hypothetical protein
VKEYWDLCVPMLGVNVLLIEESGKCPNVFLMGQSKRLIAKNKILNLEGTTN